MTPSSCRAAIDRLRQVHHCSDLATKAIHLLETYPSQVTLIKALHDPKQAPISLEALCALRSDAAPIIKAVQKTIQRESRLAWSLFGSLEYLPWLGGMRAFLTLDDVPAQSKTAMPFYVLTRNKILYPTDMGGAKYRYHVKGLWALLETCKHKQWQHIEPAALAVISQIRRQLLRPNPDLFVVYIASLLLGDIAPYNTCMSELRLRAEQSCHSLIKDTVNATLTCLNNHQIVAAGQRKSRIPAMSAS